MPPLTRWFVKFSLVYFVTALGAGVWQATGGPLWLAPVMIHLLVVGWVTGMIFGAACWMFPRYSPNQPRGTDALAVASFLLLNLGLLLRVVAEPLQAPREGPLSLVPPVSVWLIRSSLLNLLAGFTLGALLLAGKGVALLAVAGRAAEVAAAAVMALSMWTRTQASGLSPM
jgi:hypothetical protein